MSYGRRTSALALDSNRDNRRSARHSEIVRAGSALVVVKGLPPSRNVGGAMVGYSPSRRGGVGVGVGAAAGVGSCDGQGTGPGPNARPNGGSDTFCSNMQDAGPIPAGGGDVVVPKRVGAINGQIIYLITVTDPFRLADITVTDPTGLVQISSISGGRNAEFLESGTVRSEQFNSNKTMCKIVQGFDIWPGKPLSVTLVNSSLADITVNVMSTGWPQLCPPRQQ